MEFQVQAHQGKGKQNSFFLAILSDLMEKQNIWGEVHNSHKLAPTYAFSHLFQYFQTLPSKPFHDVSLLSLFLITEFLHLHHQPFSLLISGLTSGAAYTQLWEPINLLALPAFSPGTLMVSKEIRDVFPAPPFPVAPRRQCGHGVPEQQCEDCCTQGCGVCFSRTCV